MCLLCDISQTVHHKNFLKNVAYKCALFQVLVLMASPTAVVVLCGKRKSGKDHVAAELVNL